MADNFDFSLNNGEDSNDVLMRMKNDTGHEIVFITATASLFEDNELGPMVTRIDDKLMLVYNEDLIEEMIQRSVERNGDEFGEAAAAFLPLSKIVKEGMRLAEQHFG